MTAATGGARTAYPSGAHELISGFGWGSCCSIFGFPNSVFRSLFFLFSSPCQRQCELLPSLGICRPLTFHIRWAMQAQMSL